MARRNCGNPAAHIVAFGSFRDFGEDMPNRLVSSGHKFDGNFQYSRTIKQTLKKYSSCDAMLLYAGTHGCEELKGSGKCGCSLVSQQAVVNDANGHCPLSTVQVFRIPKQECKWSV
jgi:hypothetical protein